VSRIARRRTEEEGADTLFRLRATTKPAGSSGNAWEEVARGEIATSIGHDLDPHCELAVLAEDLDAAYRAVAGRLEHNDAVRIETIDGHDRPVLTPLDRLDEPPSLLALRAAVDDLLPRVDLPDVLLEVAGWTGFLTEFTPRLRRRRPRRGPRRQHLRGPDR